MTDKKRVWDEVLDYALVIIGTILGVTGIYELWNARLATYPLDYMQGDGIGVFVTIKSMMQHGWIYKNPLLGAPFGQEAYDSTTIDLLANIWQRILVTLTGNWVLAANLFFLSGYVIVGLTTLFVLKKMEIHRVIAVIGSIVFAFMPYHTMRGMGHVYLGLYYMAPFTIWLTIKLMRGEECFSLGRKWLTKNTIGTVAILLAISWTGIYYAFFSCFFFCVAFLYVVCNQVEPVKSGKDIWNQLKKQWKLLLQPILSIVIVVMGIGIAVIPNLAYWLSHGRNHAAVDRSPIGTELYSLKITQLLLPVSGHRIGKLAALRDLYDLYPLTNENMMCSLGVVMSCGFLLLLFALFVMKRIKKESVLHQMILLTYAAILLGSVGGFSTLMGLLTDKIRCYNRISVYIGMLSILMVTIVGTWLAKKLEKHIIGKVVLWVSVPLICALAIFDQSSTRMIPNYDLTKSMYDTEADFVKQIEEKEEKGAMIYQLPYCSFPENGPIGDMPDYYHFHMFLHSDTLKWSYASIKGRDGDDWNRTTGELEPNEMVEELLSKDFSGIYIDKLAYTKEEYQTLTDSLKEITREEPIVSQDARFSYFSFCNIK